MKMLEDQNGNLSSKRVSGFIILMIGLSLLTTGGVLSIFREIKDSEVFLSVCKVLMTTGGGLLGVGVLEFFKKNEEVKK